MQFKYKSYTISKDGSSPNENEDSAIVPADDTTGDLLRFAIADGATESSFSKEWAELLVSYFFTTGFNNSTFQLHHTEMKTMWLSRINAIDLPWYAQQKLELGAFSAFVGLEINRESGNSNIIAVGDSNLFHFRDDKMLLSVPIEKSVDFHRTPFLVSTEMEKNQLTPLLFFERTATFIPEDFVVLGSDAISQWILSLVESGEKSVSGLKKMLLDNEYTETDFHSWLTLQRADHAIKNDDTTIILIHISDGITEG